MPQHNASLKVFLYHIDENSLPVQALYTRLVSNGIEVRSVDNERFSSGQERDDALCGAIEECHVVLISLSRESANSLDEIKFVVDRAIKKAQGEMFLLPIRFDVCDVPDSLKRWQATDMFEQGGFGKLMLSLKLRAERLGITLNPRTDWDKPLQWSSDESALPTLEEEKPGSNILFWAAGAVVLVLALMVLWQLPGRIKSVAKTDVPADVMIQNSTQSAIEQARNRSMTQTANVEIVRAPLTQTAAMEETLQNPATPTLQFPTIMALPTEIIDPGNIRMVYVPGDNFVIGGGSDLHTIYVEPFYIDKYEVTNVLYQLCVNAGSCEPPQSASSQTHTNYYGNLEFNEYPVINVSWIMAKQYCEWRGARLPSEAEWEKAARSPDGRTYPWGEEAACSFANYSDAGGACVGDVTAVGSYKDGQSLYGAFDMSGNVAEWVNSLYWTYPYTPADGREATDTPGLRVIRGGSWFSPLGEITTYYRFGIDPSSYDPYTGFRCAHDAKL
ncbi:MAG: SUMF1/EgtB/PvdO family nonheme iron enzyme [Anaerolineales bacterium]